MQISIVTAVYNRATTIAQAIESVREQSYLNVEHVVQDGGSNDGTLEAVHAVANAKLKVYSERDNGIYDAVNKGISNASGDVIGLLHSDDFLANECVLAKVVDAFSDPTIDGVYGDLQYVAANNTARVIRHWRSGQYKPSLLSKGWMPPHPTLYLRREVFECYGLYDTSFSISADYDAMLRYLVHGKIRLAYIPEVMVRMRLGGESNRSFERIVRKSREDLRALRQNGVGGVSSLAAKNFRKLEQFLMKG